MTSCILYGVYQSSNQEIPYVTTLKILDTYDFLINRLNLEAMDSTAKKQLELTFSISQIDDENSEFSWTFDPRNPPIHVKDNLDRKHYFLFGEAKGAFNPAKNHQQKFYEILKGTFTVKNLTGNPSPSETSFQTSLDCFHLPTPPTTTFYNKNIPESYFYFLSKELVKHYGVL